MSADNGHHQAGVVIYDIPEPVKEQL